MGNKKYYKSLFILIIAISLSTYSEATLSQYFLCNKDYLNNEFLEKNPFINAVLKDDVKKFVKLTKNIKVVRQEGIVALHALVFANEPLFVHILLRAGLNPNSAAGQGSTPLICAATCGHVAIMDMLMNFGANVNLLSNNHTGALTVAIAFEHPDAVAYLLENGAKPIVKDREVTDYEVARRTHNKKIIQLLNAWNIKK